MTTLSIDFQQSLTVYEAVDRINGCVCTNGTILKKYGAVWYLAEATMAAPYSGIAAHNRDLTPTQVATFVRNFLDEGFEEPITIR